MKVAIARWRLRVWNRNRVETAIGKHRTTSVSVWRRYRIDPNSRKYHPHGFAEGACVSKQGKPRGMKATRLFTIGYEGRTAAELIDLLRAAGVSTLVDVRAIPMSRKPDFRKNKLATILKLAGIEYFGCSAIGTPRP